MLQKRINNGILIFLYFTLVLFIIVILYTQPTDLLQSIYLVIGFILSFTIRNIVLDQNTFTRESNKLLSYAKALTYMLEIALITLLHLFSPSMLLIFMMLVLLVDIVLHAPKRWYALASLALYGYSIVTGFAKLRDQEVRTVVVYSLIFSLFYLIIWVITAMIRYMINQNEIIDHSYKRLSIKNLELEKLYQSLKHAYEELEEVTILKERHRVARELHDTIGHTVTKALVSVEATKVLLQNEQDKALERLVITEESLREGLSDIRRALHLLERIEEEGDLRQEVDKVITSIKEQTGVEIESVISDIPFNGKRQKKHIVRILQEGITNGLKHGEATAFFFKLMIEGRELHFLLSDNGKGVASYVKGFGLLNMEERVRELKGMLTIETAIGDGFTIDIRIPIQGGK